MCLTLVRSSGCPTLCCYCLPFNLCLRTVQKTVEKSKCENSHCRVLAWYPAFNLQHHVTRARWCRPVIGGWEQEDLQYKVDLYLSGLHRELKAGLGYMRLQQRWLISPLSTPAPLARLSPFIPRHLLIPLTHSPAHTRARMSVGAQLGWTRLCSPP